MIKIFRYLIFSVLAILMFNCKTPGMKNTAIDDKKNAILNDDNFSRAQWPTQLQEGWLDDTMFQALVTEENETTSREEMVNKCMVRLSWLLLISGYDATRQDMPIAEKLAGSKLLQEFGQQTEFFRSEEGRQYMLIRRVAANLKSVWKEMMPKIEEKYPHLKALRKLD